MLAATSKSVVVAVSAAIVAAVAIGIASVRSDESSLAPSRSGDAVEADPGNVAEIADAWAAAWSADAVSAMVSLAEPPAPRLAEQVASFRSSVGAAAVRARARRPVVEGDAARAAVDVAVDLSGYGTWTYTTEIRLRRGDEDWRVVWSPSALHPALTAERRLALAPLVAAPGELLAADGTPLTGAAVPAGLAAQLVRPLRDAFAVTLAGVTPVDVQVIGPDGAATLIDSVGGRAPESVRTSIDLRVQAAAEAALAGVAQPAAVVAVRPSTGEVVASISNPVRGFNRALNGRYPPGSTFKVITSTALLGSGVTADTPTTCPEVARIGGREFRNAEGAALGDIPFRRAFYESCNTAFVQLAASLEGGLLTAAAERYGFNAAPTLEVPAETSSFPAPASVIDQASAAIGQGRVLATPLQMASVAASVASGAVRPLTLRAVDDASAVVGRTLPDGVAATLQELMRLVVSEGTGTAARLGGGPPVAGKTGTAEFGTARPPRTHAWFIGFRGDLALAVVVEDGGFGGRVAAPIARSVFAALG